MKVFCVALVMVLIGVLVWLHDFKEPPTDVCSPVVTSTTEKMAHGATTAGEVLYRLKDDARAWTQQQIAEAMNGAGKVWRIVWEALKLASKVGKVKADKAVTGMVPTPIDCGSCKTPDGNPVPPAVPQFDPRDAALAASLKTSSPEQLARSVARRYFPASQVDTAVAVAGAESRFDPEALSPPNYNGTRDHGLWQINTIHRDLLAAKDWRDPMANGWMAFQVWKRAGGSWRPWTTYNSGSYKRFLHDGPTAAIPEPIQPGTPAKPECEPAPTPMVQAISSGSLANLTNRRSPAEAVAFMQRMVDRQTDDGKSRCLHWVGMAYGYPTTADNWAIHQWRNAPARYKHPGDTNPPPGALMFWDTGSYGHVALSAGGGMVYSTDTSARDRVGLKPFSYFRGYGKYVGWTDGFFRGQTRTGVQV